ncbi:hypothetical protein JOQ06_020090 [Pogonophryne albipinna]|uniref:Crossover junction endonuclease MUS81 n=1 Tax=Pogonophryne albipinna TaxID=1090488 RepID=A0AAD6FUK6_9TELE|nr:hypothetical protein JOQ06_020090 [Pogonophryne albipinna]
MPASQQVRLGRKRPLPSCPNPLFLQWLTELRDAAKEKGLKLQYVYQKAISSLNKYPLPLQNAKEAKILQSFGDGICKILDQKLQRYLRENGPDAPIHSLPEGAPPAGRQDNNSLDPPRKKNAAGDQGKTKGVGGGGRRGSTYPRDGLEATLFCSHFTECLRSQAAKATCLRWSSKQKLSSSAISPSLW